MIEVSIYDLRVLLLRQNLGIIIITFDAINPIIPARIPFPTSRFTVPSVF
jgi:hypothetical protein